MSLGNECMATISLATIIDESENICQGDVFQNVKYSYIDEDKDDSVEIVEYTFPMAIVVSQACDVISMGDMVCEQGGKATKFMPSILMSPIYDIEKAKKTDHLKKAFEELSIKKLDGKDDCLFYKDDIKVVEKDWHYRFHNLSVKVKNNVVLEKAIIDFKHYFTVPATYLIKKRKNRLFHLDDLYAEQITLKFSTYLSRVAIPEP